MIKPALHHEVDQAIALAAAIDSKIDRLTIKQLEAGNADCIVYTTDSGAVIGYAIYRTSGECEVMAIGVDERYRRMGVGSQLLWWVKGLKDGAVRARVPMKNKEARMFFKSHWFSGMDEIMRYTPRSSPNSRLQRAKNR